MRKHFVTITIAVVLLSITAGIVTAAPVTQSITYQGQLTKAGGTPLTGTYSMTFRLYNVTSGGSALGTDTHSVTVNNGLFTTSVTFDSSFYNGQALWLGIAVGSDPEMTPRQEIRPVPYALNLASGVIDQVLAVVTDIQTKVNTIITKLNTIDTKLNAPPQPIRYEYYSAPMFTLETLSSLQDYTTVTNSGDSDAQVCYYKYLKQGPHDFILKTYYCISLPAGETRICSPSLVANYTYQWKVKITTNSSYVIPYTCLFKGSGTDYVDFYHPGDFLRVEIYQ